MFSETAMASTHDPVIQCHDVDRAIGLQWMNDALVFESINCCIEAGLASIPMYRISLQS